MAFFLAVITAVLLVAASKGVSALSWEAIEKSSSPGWRRINCEPGSGWRKCTFPQAGPQCYYYKNGSGNSAVQPPVNTYFQSWIFLDTYYNATMKGRVLGDPNGINPGSEKGGALVTLPNGEIGFLESGIGYWAGELKESGGYQYSSLCMQNMN